MTDRSDKEEREREARKSITEKHEESGAWLHSLTTEDRPTPFSVGLLVREIRSLVLSFPAYNNLPLVLSFLQLGGIRYSLVCRFNSMGKSSKRFSAGPYRTSRNPGRDVSRSVWFRTMFHVLISKWEAFP